MEYLHLLETSQLSHLFHPRNGETKLGQTMVSGQEFMSRMSQGEKLPRFVLLGIPEDIGPKANKGRGGSQHMWDWFLRSIINVQENDFLHGNNICALGVIQTEDLMSSVPDKLQDNNDFERAYLLVQALDMRVTPIITELFKHNCIPIIIGGGHNNTFGIISAFDKVHGSKLNVVNLDAHADLRDTESTHSGNGFSRALEGKLLESYINVGLHESYNNQHILERFKSDKRTVYYSYDALLRGDTTEERILEDIRTRVQLKPAGLELDLDSIENFPSSAQTPSGFTAKEARRWIINLAHDLDVKYFHLPEGAPQYGDAAQAGKMVAYLVTDFVKCFRK